MGLNKNESRKRLEIRFIFLKRKFVEALLRGLAKNKALSKLVLTNGALYFATTGEYSLLGEALKENISLLMLDLSANTQLIDSLEYH